MTLNQIEKTVLKEIIRECYEEYFATAEDIASHCDLTINQAKGYMGALIKKGLIAEGEPVSHGREVIRGVHSLDGEGYAVGFGCDQYSKESMLDYYVSRNIL